VKKTLSIRSVQSKAAFQEKLLEKFVQENLPLNGKKESQIDGMGDFSFRYKEIESCAAETPVNGIIEISFETNSSEALTRLSIPAVSRFFVFCTRDDVNDYKVTCSWSLS